MLGVLQSLWYQKDQNHYLDQHNQRRNRGFIPATGLCPKGVSGGKNKDSRYFMSSNYRSKPQFLLSYACVPLVSPGKDKYGRTHS